MQDETVYADDPAAMARRWADAGAELLHVVDLDGRSAESRALEAVAASSINPHPHRWAEAWATPNGDVPGAGGD
jgi:phosphoribosylformimino-5-aminoimidazole carboxamide ribonucleotide (ProFAR) isomerase